MLVDLYCQSTRLYFTGKDLQISEKPQTFLSSNILPYTVYTAINLLAMYSYSIATQLANTGHTKLIASNS